MMCAVILLPATAALACGSIIVTPGASADGSTFITYTCDWWAHGRLTYMPAADLEQQFIDLQPAVEKTAVELCRTNPELATQYLRGLTERRPARFHLGGTN